MKKTLIALLILAAMFMTACGAQSAPAAAPATEAPAAETEAPAADAPAEKEKVATAADMAGVEDVVQNWMVPVPASDLKDGSYEIAVDCSSSMFNITACTLTVENGKMTATMTMGGTGYLKVFPGTGEEAANGEGAIPYVELSTGEYTFTIPVDALDSAVNCAAFSKKKEMWYDRTLVFRADSLPLDAFADGVVVTPASLGLADGEYECAVTLSGGSGKASVQSPAALRVENGEVYATIVWSSSKYDYMRIGETRFEMLNTEGNSTFEIPVSCFDRPMAVIADTIAMSEPHEIDYTLLFDSASIK